MSERLRITNSGRVGIGTPQPISAFTVQGLTEADAIVFRHATQAGRAAVTTADAGLSGGGGTFGPNGTLNMALVDLVQNPNHKAIAVYDAAENAKAYMLVDVDERGFVVADVKSFRVPHPEKPGTDIVYAALEGPEAAAYVRGTGHLVDGEAIIDLPEHFASVASDRGLTVQLMPSSATSLGLAVVEKSSQRIVVRELMNGTGSYAFDWEVKAVRKGYEDYRVVRPQKDLSMGAIDRREVTEKTK